MTAFQICDDEYVLGSRTAPEIFLTNVLKQECAISHRFMTNFKIPHIFYLPLTFHFYFLLANKYEGCVCGYCGEADVDQTRPCNRA